MSFKDIINGVQQQLESQQGGDFEKVQYPQTKNERLFIGNNNPNVVVQILPSSDLQSMFAEGIRKIYLKVRTSKGKELSNFFTLSPEPDAGSLLENKIAEWTEKQMIPFGYKGSQATPQRSFLVNAVKVFQDQNTGAWFQERDNQGNLVVRLLELRQSAFQGLINKLQDPMLNTSGTELSFMDINKGAPVQITKPAQGSMSYDVQVYPQFQLPPLGQGWENQLEDLKAHATPTEYLENGAQWVQAWVDMTEGRSPSDNGQSQQSQGQQQTPNMSQSPQGNPYASQAPQQQGQSPFGQNQQQGVQQTNTNQAPPQQFPNTQSQQAPTQQGYGQYEGQGQAPTQQQNPTMPDPFVQQQQTQQPQMPNTNPNPPQSEGMGVINSLPVEESQQPQQNQQQGVQQPNMNQAAPQGNTGGQAPDLNNVPQNDNGLPNLDEMLDAELGE